MGLGNYLNTQHSNDLLSRRSPSTGRVLLVRDPRRHQPVQQLFATVIVAHWSGELDEGLCLVLVREFERHALTQAYTVPILWYNRIVPTTANVRGWNMTPSQYIGQDLADAWLGR